MLRKSFSSIFLLLTLAHSTLGIITGIHVPTSVLHPGRDFTVTFTTEDHIIQNAQYYIIFGLNPGTTPPGGSNVGEVVLTAPGSDLVATHHSITGHGSFEVDVRLPKDFNTGSKKALTHWTLTAAVFQVVSFWFCFLSCFFFFANPSTGWSAIRSRCCHLRRSGHYCPALRLPSLYFWCMDSVKVFVEKVICTIDGTYCSAFFSFNTLPL